MKLPRIDIRIGITLTVLAALAVAGWVLFFKTYTSRGNWRNEAEQRGAAYVDLRQELFRINAEQAKNRRNALLDSELEVAAHKLSELMIKIQTKERELNSLEAKVQNLTATNSKDAKDK